MDNAVAYFSGGTMRGVFGAGVATFLEQSVCFECITDVRTASAGTITAAYLRARMAHYGSLMFWDELIDGFISTKGFWGGMYDRVANRYLYPTPRLPVRNAVNLDRVFEAVCRTKYLPFERLLQSTGPNLWVKLLDLESGEVLYFNINEHDPLTLMRAAISLIPYVSHGVELDGRVYADAAMVESIGYETLRKHHPHEKLVVVFNGDVGSLFKNRAKNRIEAWFASMEHGEHYYERFLRADEEAQQDIERIKQDPRALLVTCPQEALVSTRTCDPVRLKRAHAAGMAAGRQIEAFLCP